MCVGLDTHKAKIAVAVAEPGRSGEVRFRGEIANRPEAVRQLLERLAEKHGRLRVCYEAGPCGYGLHRQITALGHDCTVVAPSLIPRKPGERVKTNRRDALTLARLHRAGELTGVWIPDPTHEAMRDLVRARTAAMEAVRRARQQLQGFLLRHGRVFTGRKAWSPAHRRWLAGLRFEHPAQQIVLQEQIDASTRPSAAATAWRRRSGSWCRAGRWRRWSRPCRRCAASPSFPRWCWRPRSATSAASPTLGS